MAGTWDAMYAQLAPVYGGMPDFTTQDMLFLFWADEGFTGFPGNDARYEFYVSQGATGSTLGDLENSFWSTIGIGSLILFSPLGSDQLITSDGNTFIVS
jgi:hypothetical protein